MKTITHNELLEMLSGKKGAMLVGLESLTDSRARKNPFNKIFKKVRAVGMVGANYENAVNRQLAAEGQMPVFEAQPLPWGEWLIPNKVITHKGELYLRTQTTSNQRRKQPAKVLRYCTQTNRTLTPAQVKQYLPEVVASETQAEVGIEDVERQVWIRVYKFSSLLRVRLNGKTFRVFSEEAILEDVVRKLTRSTKAVN